MDLLIAGLFFAGTALQMTTSLRDFKSTRRDELVWWNAEDELVAEVPWWRWLERGRVRRELRRLREPKLHAEIRHMTRVFLGWIMLWLGALGVLAQAVFRW